MTMDTPERPAALSRQPARLSQWAGYAIIAGLRFLAIGVGVLYVKFYTGVVSAEALGLFFYLTTLSYALNALVFVPLDFFVQARLAGRTDPLPLPALARLGGVAAASALLLAAIGGSILLFLGRIIVIDIVGAVVMALLLAGCTSGRNILNNRGSRFFVVLMFVLESAGRIAALFAVTAMTRPDGRMLFYSAGAALAVELVVIVLWVQRTIGTDRSTGDDVGLSPRMFFRSSLPVSVSAICNLVQLQSFRLLWVWAGFPATAAVFAVVANVGQSGMAAAGQVLSQILLPRVYQTRGAFILTYVRLAAVAVAIVMAVGLALSTQIVGLLTQPSYVPNAPLIAYGILVEGANLVITGITAVMMMRSRTWRMLPCNLAGATIALAGNGIALYYFPQTPAAIGIPLLLSQMVVLGSLTMLLRTSHEADRL